MKTVSIFTWAVMLLCSCSKPHLETFSSKTTSHWVWSDHDDDGDTDLYDYAIDQRRIDPPTDCPYASSFCQLLGEEEILGVGACTKEYETPAGYPFVICANTNGISVVANRECSFIPVWCDWDGDGDGDPWPRP